MLCQQKNSVLRRIKFGHLIERKSFPFLFTFLFRKLLIVFVKGYINWWKHNCFFPSIFVFDLLSYFRRVFFFRFVPFIRSFFVFLRHFDFLQLYSEESATQRVPTNFGLNIKTKFFAFETTFTVLLISLGK